MDSKKPGTGGEALAASDLIAGGGGLLSSISKADAIGQQSMFVQQQLKLNEELASIRSKQALRQGEFETTKMQEQTAQMVGGQRAASAASGVNVNTGTSKEIQKQTAEIGAKDFATIENNAFLKSLGFQIEGENESMKATQVGLASKNEQRDTIFGGGIELFSNTMRAVSDLDAIKAGG
jgi:hypothetical protein